MTPEQDRAVQVFADAAMAYCALIDAPVQGGVVAPSRQLSKALSEVYVAALDLPDVFDDGAPEPDGAYSPNAQTLQAWIQLLCVDHYWEIFEPTQPKPDEPVLASLADDLRDIYTDLKRGLDLFHKGHETAAAWEWRFNFHAHWGRHLVSAQRAIFLASQP
jgi:hypothetical protein